MSFLKQNAQYHIQVVHIPVESAMRSHFTTHGQDTKMNLFGELLGLLKPLEMLKIWLEVIIGHIDLRKRFSIKSLQQLSP